ncbi:MAG: hypothetical protein GJ676_08905 [Rhodobacteraceae bacterium]|nr:hypothetical protein [Paracoccaceae bacterium]
MNKLKTGQIDQAWSAKKAWQQEFHGGRLLGAEFTSSRYEKFAELCKDKGNCGLRCELRWTAETPRSV